MRDPQGSGHSDTFVRLILSHGQRAINARVAAITEESTLTLEPRRLMYDVNSLLGDSMRVVNARYRGADLMRASPRSLMGFDPEWARKIEDGPHTFALYGRNLLVLYPGTEDVTDTVTIVSTKDTGLIVSDTENISLPDHLVPLLTDFTEAILLLRQRDFGKFAGKLQALTEKLEAYAVV